MSSTAAAFRHAPQGFFTAHETLNRLSEGVYTQMVLDLLQSTLTQSGAVPPASYVQSASAASISAGEVSSCLQALTFIFRVLSAQQLSAPDIVSLLQKETDLNDQKRTSLAQLFSDFTKSSTSNKLSTVSRTLSLGRLVNLSWRVGVGISSSQADALAAPFVTLAFEIAVPAGSAVATAALPGANGVQQPSALLPTAASSPLGAPTPSTRTYIVECTHHEFQEVRKHFYDIFAQLDAI